MKLRILCLTLFIGSVAASPAFSQDYPKTGADFIRKQKKQETTIKAAQRSGKVSDNEYEKLMQQQERIKDYLVKANMDDIWTAKEKNHAYDMLRDAEKRLARYKTNGEIY